MTADRSTPCYEVAEKLALGEPLSACEEHIATCPDCSRLTTMPRLLAAASHAAEPKPGFVIRATAGARTKLARRRRNRIVGSGIAALAAAAIGVWSMRPSSPSTTNSQAAMDLPRLEPVNSAPDPKPSTTPPLTDHEVGAELLRISNFRRAMAPSPRWREAEAPLSLYRLVVHEGASR